MTTHPDPRAAFAEARHQWRITFHSSTSEKFGACFVDAKDEAAALKFFAQAFPRCTVVGVKLEPVNPCAQYEKRPT